MGENPRQVALATAPVNKLIWSFALPAILSQVVSSMNNIVDQTFMGWGIGDLAIAAANVSFPVFTLIIALACLVGVGCASGYSLFLGRRDEAGARKNLGTAVVLSAAVGILLAVVGLVFLEPMLYLFGATEAMMPYARPYTFVILLGVPFGIFSTAMAHVIRADGSPRYSSAVLLSGAIFNMIFDPILLFGFDMGVQGIALATVLGQILSAVLAVCYLARRLQMVHPSRGDFRPDAPAVKHILALGGPIFCNHILMTFSQILLMNMLRTYGAQSVYGSEITIAGAGAVGKVNIVLLSCIIGIALGSQPILGFNYGRKNYSRVVETYQKALLYGTLVAVAAFLILQLFPRRVAGLFGSEDPLFYDFAVHYVRIYLLMNFCNALQPITSNFFTAIGKAQMGLWMTLVRQGVLLIPMLLILPPLLGLDGVLWAGPISDGGAAVVVLLLGFREVRRLKALQAAQEKEASQ